MTDIPEKILKLVYKFNWMFCLFSTKLRKIPSWYFGWSPPGISISSIISGRITSGSGSSSSGSSGITSGIGSGLGSGITSGIFGITGPSGAMGFNSGSTGFQLILSGSGSLFSSKSNLGGVSGIGESLFSGVIL